jgi:hypothetical protein
VSPTDQQLERKRFMLYNLPYVLLYVAAFGLVALTAHNAADTSTYWQMFIPLMALVSILGGWRWAGASGDPRWMYVARQVLHWGALILVIRLLYAHDVQDFLNDEQDSFVIIYMVGLAAVLSGIYLDWKMAVFGLFLLFSAVGMAWLDDNAMLLLIVGVVALAAVVVSLLVRGKLIARKHAEGVSPASL